MSNFIVRDTFGIVYGRTGKLYPDLIEYFLEVTSISKSYLSVTKIYSSKDTEIKNNNIEEYRIHMDSKLKKTLKNLPDSTIEVPVIISYQKRTTGNFAFIRLFQQVLRNKQEGKELKND